MQEPDYSLATEVHSKDEAFQRVIGGDPAERVQATEEFTEHASKVVNLASRDTYSYMFNVQSLRQQLTDILNIAGRDNAIRNIIAPMAEKFHIAGF